MIFKFPKKAKRVFRGVLFDIYQWPQKMFDGSISIFEIARRQDTVVIMATTGKKIIVLKQKQPDKDWYYDMPAGRMDKPGETPKHAAVRELMEETGYKPGKIVLWKKVVQGEAKVLNTVYFFKATNCVKVAGQQLDNGEKIQISLYTFDDFLKLAELPNSYFGSLMTVEMLKAQLNPIVKKHLKKEIFFQ